MHPSSDRYFLTNLDLMGLFDMRLIRHVLVKFSELPEDLTILNKAYGDVLLNVNPITEFNRSQNMILMHACTTVLYDPVTADDLLDVRNDVRRKCEEVIEMATRALAVCYGVRREIFSPAGYSVGYLPDSDEEFKRLSCVKGGAFNHAKILFKRAVPLTNFNWEEAFKDRQEGVLLMSEAFNQTSYSGQFRDFMRLFENAFKLSTDQFSKKLSSFLNPKFGYTRQEVINWYKLRHPLSHADQKQSAAILYEADVVPVIDRVAQAAYDVFLNKALWNDSSTDRRNTWTPDRYSTNESGEGTICVGAKRISFLMTDPYNIYPTLGVEINGLPDNFVLFKPLANN